MLQRGAFKSLRHMHQFFDAPGGTLMRDTLEYEALFDVLGLLIERLILTRYMTQWFHERRRNFKDVAERGRN